MNHTPEVDISTANDVVVNQENEDATLAAVKPKKRGRKPKGGKIIIESQTTDHSFLHEPNIILHLKCGEIDLAEHNFNDNHSVETFQFESANNMNYHLVTGDGNTDLLNSNSNSNLNKEAQYDNNNNNNNNNMLMFSNANFEVLTASTAATTVDKNQRLTQEKLKELKHNLYSNNISDKKSACFWCTYDFEQPPIFIPKQELNGTYQCYGCFCSPECAAAFLFKENIDSSTMFERYQWLNYIYCKIYAYEKNIKPAPNPYYTLSKFYGNLSIEEYRQLLTNERILLVVDKPISRILPELHEDNDDFMFSGTGKIIPPASRDVKYKLRKKVALNKLDIVNDTFNVRGT